MAQLCQNQEIVGNEQATESLSEIRNTVLRLQHFCSEFLLQSVLFQKELILLYDLARQKMKRKNQGYTQQLSADRRMQWKYRKGNLYTASSRGLQSARIQGSTAEIYSSFPDLPLWQD